MGGVVSLSFLRIDTKMTNFQAFCNGFWSAWDFTRPFSEKASAFPGEARVRTPEEIKAKYERLREELGLNKSAWEEVGDHMYKAISTFENEINNDDPKQQRKP